MTPYENVTFKERLHEEAAKLKEMSFKDKFWYIWEYYKFHILALILAVAALWTLGGILYRQTFTTRLSIAIVWWDPSEAPCTTTGSTPR